MIIRRSRVIRRKDGKEYILQTHSIAFVVAYFRNTVEPANLDSGEVDTCIKQTATVPNSSLLKSVKKDPRIYRHLHIPES